MDKLTPDQRNHYYRMEAGRTGIHQPILAALYTVQRQPPLGEGETGLGLGPVHRVALTQVETFPDQVRFAANTLRHLTQTLVAQGWTGPQLWNAASGRYTDRFLDRVAQGYVPSVEAAEAAQLEPCDGVALGQAYLEAVAAETHGTPPHPGLAQLDPALLAFAERLPPHYDRMAFQRHALVEAVRVWHQADSVAAVYEAFAIPAVGQRPDDAQIDAALLTFLGDAPQHYGGYPHQREALLRLVQGWYRLDSRARAIETLLAGDPFAQATTTPLIDAALIAFGQRLPATYRGQGDQRFALTEAYRAWFNLESRNQALHRLGINPEDLVAQANNPDALLATAQTLDRSLLTFVQTLPTIYTATEAQREILLGLVQRWRNLDGRAATVQALLDEVRRMERAAPTDPDAMPVPTSTPAPPRPPRWTPQTLHLGSSLIPNGHFTWAEATQGGRYLPPNQTTVDAIVRMAELIQQARDRLGRPFIVTQWYRPAEDHPSGGEHLHPYHHLGNAIEGYWVGLTGHQVYWFLDPWWPGGLGRYRHYPHLVHLDAGPEPARWIH